MFKFHYENIISKANILRSWTLLRVLSVNFHNILTTVLSENFSIVFLSHVFYFKSSVRYRTGWSATVWRTAVAVLDCTVRNTSRASEYREAKTAFGFSSTYSLRPRPPSYREPLPRDATLSPTFSTVWSYQVKHARNTFIYSFFRTLLPCYYKLTAVQTTNSKSGQVTTTKTYPLSRSEVAELWVAIKVLAG